jgi:hypothetical protein
VKCSSAAPDGGTVIGGYVDQHEEVATAGLKLLEPAAGNQPTHAEPAARLGLSESLTYLSLWPI